MFIKSDSNFSIFISDLRRLTGRDREIKALSERREMIDCTNRYYEPSNVLKSIYFAVNKDGFDTMLFIKAIGSTDFNTKKYGYLGLLLTNDNDYFILTFNTLMKDLKDKTTREVALNFLCNVNIKDNIYNDLSGFICTRSSNDKYIVKSTIAKSKITTSERISLVGNNDNLIFAKIQILLNKLLTNEDVTIMDNDTLFLTSFYGTTKNLFLKVKLIQLYKILNEQKKIKLTKAFFQCIERDIILPHESIKPLVDISLSIEIVDLLISTSNTSQKVESFLFRLIDSLNPNSRFMGFKLAVKHKIFQNQVIDKAIKWGLHNADCYETFMFFVNRSSHKEIYKRKEEIRFMMDKQDVKENLAKIVMKNVILKILENAKDELYLKIYFEHPELCLTNPLDRNISQELKSMHFKKLLQKNKTKYFCLLYSLLPRNYKDLDFYKELFQNHLLIILNSQKKKRGIILERLIMTYLHFENLNCFRDLLVEKYHEVGPEFKQIMLDGIYLMNSKCSDSVLLLQNDIVLRYCLVVDVLRIKIKGSVGSVEVRNGGEKAKRNNTYFDASYSIYEYELLSSRDVVIALKINNQIITKNLYLHLK